MNTYLEYEDAIRVRMQAEEWFIEASRPFFRQLADLYACCSRPRFYVEGGRITSLPSDLPDDLKPLERSLKDMIEHLRVEAAHRAECRHGLLVRNPARS
jgi:hypothetical protein